MIRFLKSVRAHALRAGDRVEFYTDGNERWSGTVHTIDNLTLTTVISLEDGRITNVARNLRIELVERK